MSSIHAQSNSYACLMHIKLINAQAQVSNVKYFIMTPKD